MGFLEREFDILKRVEHLGCTPRPVALFREWEHLFLAQERVHGVGLRSFLTRVENITLPYVHRDGVVARFIPKFKRLACGTIDAVRQLHGAGLTLGDLSLTNVMVDPDTLRVTLIDLESAVFGDDASGFAFFSKHWVTPGFDRPGRMRDAGVSVADDYYALGMILYNMWITGLEFFHLKPSARTEFLDALVPLGMPVPARLAIEALFDGDPERATSVLQLLDLVEVPHGAI